MQAWAAGFLACPVVFAQQNAPAPAGLYVTVQVLAMPRIRHATEGSPNNSGVAQIVDDIEPSVRLQSFGENAFATLEAVRDSLSKPTVLSSLRSAGLAFVDVLSGVDDISQVMGGTVEQRAGLDLRFRCAGVTTDNVGVIETVEITAVAEVDDDTAYTDTIEIGA